MKSNQQVQPVVSDDYSTVTFKTKGHPDIVLEMSALHPDVVKRAAAVGMAQVRIVDAAAIPATDENGKIMPESVRLKLKFDRMAALVEHYMTGTAEWSRAGAGGGGRSITVEAIARIKGCSYDDAAAHVGRYADAHYKGDTKAALAFLRDGKRVQEAMAAIRAERQPAPKIDADKALEEIA